MAAMPLPETYWVEEGRLLAGKYPGAWDVETTKEQLQLFLDVGITCFLDLTEENELLPYSAWLADRAMHCRHPIPDFSVPREHEMVQILDALDAALEEGHRVYLHCYGGTGRTATVVGCYLVRHGMEGNTALATIGQLRRASGCSWSQSPETEAQCQMVLEWREGR